MVLSNIQSGLYKALAEAGRHFATKLSDAVSQNNLPNKISKAISVDSPVVGDTESYVDIKIDTSEGAAPMARAFEWGSGIHSERRERVKYPITPKDIVHGFLAIPAERWPNKEYDDDPAILKYVLHPGVAPRPYIIPTIKAEKEQIKRILAREFKASILLGVEKITVIE